eukprot:CAMPEP_0180207838 /NCGR_PEP_ID=MMETSP0987-20121128/10394_1 /TAXON_ID=697907 /ORGANISM="non described non described, Strain CCMP2293" /LENGTH=81 /DNA_ID=CAMNT_0022163893 /DNA_START=473 /DNA_END=715 /DNA_ORIENTATION=+
MPSVWDAAGSPRGAGECSKQKVSLQRPTKLARPSGCPTPGTPRRPVPPDKARCTAPVENKCTVPPPAPGPPGGDKHFVLAD